MFLLTIILLSFSCKAQQVSLNIPYSNITNGMHIKDTNNEYNKFLGTWKSNFNNQTIFIYIEKQLDRSINSVNKNYYSDVLIVRYEIKNSSNQIVRSTKNVTNDNVNIISRGMDTNNLAVFSYSGGGCNVGWGSIGLQYVDTNHIKWSYYPNSTLTVNCPNSADTTIYLPETKDLVFTKE